MPKHVRERQRPEISMENYYRVSELLELVKATLPAPAARVSTISKLRGGFFKLKTVFYFKPRKGG